MDLHFKRQNERYVSEADKWMLLFWGLKLRGIMMFKVEKMALVQILLLLFPFMKSSQTDHFSTIGSSEKIDRIMNKRSSRESRKRRRGVCFKS